MHFVSNCFSATLCFSDLYYWKEKTEGHFLASTAWLNLWKLSIFIQHRSFSDLSLPTLQATANPDYVLKTKSIQCIWTLYLKNKTKKAKKKTLHQKTTCKTKKTHMHQPNNSFLTSPFKFCLIDFPLGNQSILFPASLHF